MKPFDKTKVKVLVADKKQAKQFKAILKGLGEQLNMYFWDESNSNGDYLVFVGNKWMVSRPDSDQGTITIKELIQGLSEQTECNRVFVMRSVDGVDLFEGDIAHWCIKKDCVKYLHPLELNHAHNMMLHAGNDTYRLFSTKEAAEKWIEEQNKPIEVTVKLFNNHTAKVTNKYISIKQGLSNFTLMASDIEAMHNGLQSLKEGTSC